ncbi:hypothetical protein [Spirulina subsalsa]|uniref:hypothetical protein n=1 Tax=Spirulina subsalsa TaxID=54311 RepID=UPI0002F27EEA|nr:hypothetical protein [Spirulina subsalsa]
MVSFNLRDPQYRLALQHRIEMQRQSSLATWIEPELLEAARVIYYTYYQVHKNVPWVPLGVVINARNRRGTLVFHFKPALLPRERFIPLEEIV